MQLHTVQSVVLLLSVNDVNDHWS